MRPLGRARGLIRVWEQTRREERERLSWGGIWTHMVGNSGRGRAATLVLLREMVAHNVVRAPGQMKSNSRKGRGLPALNDSYPTSGMGRTRVRNPGPHPLPEPPLCLPYTWPQCLCRCRYNLTAPPSPPNSDSDSTSGPPSLESITDPNPWSQVMRHQIQPQVQAKNTPGSCLCFVCFVSDFVST